ncbi:MAG: ATP-binding cassette domain-containing protein [Chitinophagales bacterium]
MSAAGLTIELHDVAKKFGATTIFKEINALFTQGNRYAIVGANGSGKSTLIKIIAGYMSPDRGTISYQLVNPVPPEEVSQLVAISAPYVELPEELTVEELVHFHAKLKGLSIAGNDLIQELQIARTKEIRHCSSGMKQRLKLALALYSKATILLLDEPTANFDDVWKHWYHNELKQQSGKLIVIASNEPAEYEGASQVIQLGLI